MNNTRPTITRLLVGVGAATVACLGIVSILCGLAEREEFWRPIGIASGLATLGLILALRSLGFDWFSAPVVYLCYLWLFHFPLVLFTCLSPGMVENIPPHIYRWTLTPSWYRATLLAVSCAAGFTAGIPLLKPTLKDKLGRAVHDTPLAWFGFCEALLGAGLVAVSIIQGGGQQVFETAYIDLYASVFSGPFSYGVMIFTFGMATGLASAKRRFFPLLLGALVVWACVVLLLGARSSAFLGVLVAVTVLAKRGINIPRWVAVASIAGMLWLCAVVGVARQGAVQNNLSAAATANPLDALLEMGGSLYTVSLFESWVSSGDHLQLGGGYWLPFERGIGSVFPSLRSDLNTDPRAANLVLLSRASGLGGSVVAEAYYNFGLLAPFIVFVPMGWLMAYIDRSARAPGSIACLAALFYPLMMQVRSWFISVPAMIAIGTIPLILLTISRRRKRPAPVNPPRRVQKTMLARAAVTVRCGIK